MGDGVYKTTDGGDNWQQRRPREHRAHRAHRASTRSDPDTVFVCATGHLWDANPERGVYRTARRRQDLEAGAVRRRRHRLRRPRDGPAGPAASSTPACGSSGARPTSSPPAARAAASTRAPTAARPGEARRRACRPGDLGRIAIAVAPVAAERRLRARRGRRRPRLYRSDDRGETWTRDQHLGQRHRRARSTSRTWSSTPPIPNRVYKPGFDLAVSDDGGKTFSARSAARRQLHGDIHALWVNPNEPGAAGPRHRRRRLRLRTTAATRWRFVGTLPVVAVLPRQLRHGLAVQRLRRPAGQRHLDRPVAAHRRHRRTGTGASLGGGDGFWAFARSHRPRRRLREYQGGNLFRIRQSTGETQGHQARCRGQGEPEVPLQLEHADPPEPERSRARSTTARSSCFRSRDRGETLGAHLARPHHQRSRASRSRTSRAGSRSTTRRPRTTARSSPSASRRRTATSIWVGTDDGNLQVTRDGGKTWTNVVDERARAADRHLGVDRRGRAASTRAPPTSPSTAT